MSNRPEFIVWLNVRRRCLLPSHPAYGDYGGRGIDMAPEWRHDFAAFYAHVGPRPELGPHGRYSLDRIDNNKGYFPGNVRWATRKQQALNRRTVHVMQARIDLLEAFIDARGWPVPAG